MCYGIQQMLGEKMSLYNIFFGVNPMAGLVLNALGITEGDVPRFRDAWLTEDGKLAIHTRTGGGNRDMYEHEARARRNYPEYFDGENPPTGPWNADLRKLPGFEYDEDDDYDSTYATFYFTPSPEWGALIKTMQSVAGSPDAPRDKWAKALGDLRANGGPKTEAGQRALSAGEATLAQIDASPSQENTNG